MTAPKFIQIKAMNYNPGDNFWDEAETWAGTTHICIYKGEPGAYEWVADFSKDEVYHAVVAASCLRDTYDAEIERVQFDLVLDTKDAPADDGWVEWNGGHCPLQGNTQVEITLRDGDRNAGSAGDFMWFHADDNSDIVRYRVIKPVREQTIMTEPKPHPHAALMAEYAKDAAETEAPWERWEMRHKDAGGWATCQGHPNWVQHRVFRRKPQTITVNGFEVPKPMAQLPAHGTRVYWPVLLAEEYCFGTPWTNGVPEQRAFARKLLHATPEAATAHAKAMLGIDPNAT